MPIPLSSGTCIPIVCTPLESQGSHGTFSAKQLGWPKCFKCTMRLCPADQETRQGAEHWMLRRDCRRRRRQTPRCDRKACRHSRKEEVLHLIQLLYCSDSFFAIRHSVIISPSRATQRHDRAPPTTTCQTHELISDPSPGSPHLQYRQSFIRFVAYPTRKADAAGR